MTAVAPTPTESATARRRFGSTPLYLFTGEAMLIFSIVVGAGAYKFDRMALVLLIAAALSSATVALAPRGSFGKVRVPLTAILLIAWMFTTIFWARNTANWIGEIRGQLWTFIPITLAVGLLPLDRIVKAMLRTGYLILFLQVESILFDPQTRGNVAGVGIDAGFGWRGTFIHKNGMATVLLIFMIFVLSFERRKGLRLVTAATTVVFILMSRSSTGISSLAGVAVFALWLRAYLAKPLRQRSAFAISWSIIAGILAAVIVSFAAVLVGLYGKDLTFSSRTIIWSAMLDLMSGWRWITGWSVDAYVLSQQTPAIDLRNSAGFGIPHMHNGVMEMLFVLGIPGVILATIMVFTPIRHGWSLLRESPRVGRWLVLTGAAIVLFNFSEVKVVTVWLSLLVLMTVVAIRARDEGWDGPAELGPPLAVRRHERRPAVAEPGRR